MERLLLGDKNLAQITAYEADGGYSALRKAYSMDPSAIIAEIKRSCLRGRGGAGFPVHLKWSNSASDPKTPRYIVCNADEGEPGTFKDRGILEHNPHLLIEGMCIAGRSIDAQSGYIYLRGEYPRAHDILKEAILQALENCYLGNDVLGTGKTFNIHLHRGAGAYICGEETALLESLEGRRGQPRVRPPYPVNEGFMARPTVVNNVETLANIPVILKIGGEAYSNIGTPLSPGPKLFAVSGHVAKPGLLELPMGTTLREIIYDHAGGIRDGQTLKAVIPGGLSSPVLTPEEIDCPMDFASMPKCGSMLGSGAVIVFDDTSCMVRLCQRALRFFEHESCGKCTPCREGTGWLRQMLDRLEAGKGTHDDLSLMKDIADNMLGKTFCTLGDSAAMVLTNLLEKFHDEFKAHVHGKACPFIKTT